MVIAFCASSSRVRVRRGTASSVKGGLLMASQEHHPVDVNLAKLAADFAAEGDPEPECNVGIAGRLPRKNVASGALIFNQSHEILFVVPAYKPYLDVPGGMAEDGESPLIACRREVREELGLDLDINRLLLVDWVPTHGIWHDSLQSIYSGGVLDPSQVNRITLSSEEVSDVTFLHLHDGGLFSDLDRRRISAAQPRSYKIHTTLLNNPHAVPKLRPSLARRLETALTALSDMTLKYAEFGRVTTTLKQDHARPP